MHVCFQDLAKLSCPLHATVIEKLRGPAQFRLARRTWTNLPWVRRRKIPASKSRVIPGICRGCRADQAADRPQLSPRMQRSARSAPTPVDRFVNPRHCRGVVGLKPSYGRVSRFGLVAFASSLDQVGPLTKTVRDSALLMNAIAGPDRHDSTSLKDPVPDYTRNLGRDLKGIRLGLPKEYHDRRNRSAGENGG